MPQSVLSPALDSAVKDVPVLEMTTEGAVVPVPTLTPVPVSVYLSPCVSTSSLVSSSFSLAGLVPISALEGSPDPFSVPAVSLAGSTFAR